MLNSWFSFYAGNAQKLHQLGGEIQTLDNQIARKLQQFVGEIQQYEETKETGMALPGLFMCVPWGHHIQILSKCKNIDEALFYIVRTASEGWSRNTLINCIKADYYHLSGSAITNFREILLPGNGQPLTATRSE